MKKEISYRQMEERTETVTICDHCGREVVDVVMLAIDPKIVVESLTGRRRVRVAPGDSPTHWTGEGKLELDHGGIHHLHQECVEEAFGI